jgi:hypothetical protein
MIFVDDKIFYFVQFFLNDPVMPDGMAVILELDQLIENCISLENGTILRDKDY